jgi:toxin FitB
MLLDSNILIYAANGSDSEIQTLVTAEDSAISCISKIEVYGFTHLKPEEEAALDVIFARLIIHAVGDSVVERAILLRRERRMRLADAIIAATALVHQVPLVTRNTEDFKHIESLILIDPFQPKPPVG